jgi:diacylglycerol kinase (ATP)
MAFCLSERARSFRHAFRGIVLVARSQHNAWIHALATIGVAAAGLWFGVTRWEWCALVFAIGLVWTAEALNTALEFLADEISQERRELIGKAKDAGAGGVLLASITAAIIGVIVFVPHILAWMETRP